jgi:hypothetical protein
MMIYRRVPLSFINMFISVWWFTGEYHYSLLILILRYSWNIAKVGIKHQSINQSINNIDRRISYVMMKHIKVLSVRWRDEIISLNRGQQHQTFSSTSVSSMPGKCIKWCWIIWMEGHVRYSSVNIVDWLINWLVFNANFSNISAIS